MTQYAEVMEIEAQYRENVAKAARNRDEVIEKAKKDYILTVNDWDAVRKTRLDVFYANHPKY